MRRRIPAVLGVLLLAALAACNDRTLPTATDAGFTRAGSAPASVTTTWTVETLINALFEGSNRGSALSMWQNIQKERQSKTVNLKALTSLINNLVKFSLENLGRGRILDPDGAGPLNATSGVVKMLGMVFQFAGVTPTELPPPPAGFDAVFALVDPAATGDQRFVTSFGDAATFVHPGSFDEKVLLVVVRQPDEVQVNTPYPKLSKTFDVAIAPTVPFSELTLLMCPLRGLGPVVNGRAVIAHQKNATEVEYLNRAEGNLTCPEDLSAAWRHEKGFFRQRTMQLASYAQKAVQFIGPKPLYAGHAAIGGVIFFDDDALSPMVLVDPYVETGITPSAIAATTYGDGVNASAELKITVGPPVLVGNAVPSLTVFASVDGGLAQPVETDASGIARWQFPCTRAGDHTVSFTLPLTHVEANAPLYGPSSNTATFRVIPRALSVIAYNATREYGDENPPLSGTVGTLYCKDVVTAAYSTTTTLHSNVGESLIAPSLSAADGVLDNYDVTLTPGVLTITPAPLTLTAKDDSRLYGDENPDFTGTLAGKKFVEDDVVLSLSPDATTASDVGTYDIVPSAVGESVGNYYVKDKKTGTLTIKPAPLTLTIGSASRRYGEPNPSFATVFDGIRNGDRLTATATTDANRLSNVGTYSVTAIAAGDKLGNYTLTIEYGPFTITPRPLSIMVAKKAREYGELNPVFTGTVDGALDDDGLVITYASTATPTSHAGPYAITFNVEGPPILNYDVTGTNGTLTITAAPLTVTLVGGQLLYGSDACLVTYSEFKSDDGPSSLGGTLACTVGGSSLANPAPIGTYSVMPGGLTSLDYAIAFVPASVTVKYNTAVGHAFISPLPQANVEAGRTLPVKFKLFMVDGVTPVTTASATVTMSDVTIPPGKANFVFTTSGEDGGHYQVNINLPSYVAKGSHVITAFLNDGSTISITVIVK